MLQAFAFNLDERVRYTGTMTFLRRRFVVAATALAALFAAAGVMAEGSSSWWLNVLFHINGEWRLGHEFDGWSPREYGSQAECAERMAFAEAACRDAPLDYPAAWVCSPGEPLNEPPPPMQGTLC